MAIINVGRIKGSLIYSGAAATDAAIKQEVTAPLERDIYITSICPNMYWQFNGIDWLEQGELQGGGIVGEFTYAQLQGLTSTNSLLVGSKYIMTDFQSLYYSFDGSLQTVGGRILGDDTHLGVDGLPHPSPIYRLMLTALSATEFAAEVVILEAPNIPNIAQWHVEYNITHIPQYGSNHKGAIVRMVSPNKVDICYDFVNTLWWRTRDEIIEFQPSAAIWDASVTGRYFHTFNCFNETNIIPINLAYTPQALSDITFKSNIHNMGVEGGALSRDYPTTPTTPIDTDQVYNCGNNVFITTIPYANATEFCYEITFDMGCMCNTFVAQIISGITFAHLNRYFKLYAPKGYVYNITFGHSNELGGKWVSTNGTIVANELGMWCRKINITASSNIVSNYIGRSVASELNLSAPLGSIEYNSVEKAFGSSGVHIKSNSGSIKYNNIGTISNSTLEATKGFGYNLFELVNNSTISATKTGSIGSLSYNKFYRVEQSIIESGALQNSVINLFLNSNWLTTGGCKYNNIHVFTKSTLRGTSVTSFVADEVNECILGSDNIPIEPVNISGKLYKETYSDLALYVTDQSSIAANSARLTAVETTKADLGTDGYVYPAQISPLQGKQTGVEIAGAGRYTKTLPDEITQQLVSASFSLECYFEWDNSTTVAGTTYDMFSVKDKANNLLLSVYRQAGGSMSFQLTNINGGKSETSNLPTLTRYGANHIVLTVDRVNQLFIGYLNGIQFGVQSFNKATSEAISATFEVGTSRANAKQFTARHSRIFNYILSQGDVNMLYNSGSPEALMLSNAQKPPMWIAPDTNVFYSVNNHPDITPSTEVRLEDVDGFSGKFRKIVRTATGTAAYNRISVYFNPRLTTVFPGYKAGMPMQIELMYRSNVDFDISSNSKAKHNLEAPCRITAYTSDPISNVLIGFSTAANSNIMDDSPTAWIEYQIISVRSVTCIAEYLPCGLLADRWRDTSGNGNDLMATGSVALSYGKRYSGSALTPLFVAQGVVYNDKTGYYEYNGLTDITEAQMCEIYYRSTGLLGGNWTSAFYLSHARTVIAKEHAYGTVDATECFRLADVEVLKLSSRLEISPVFTTCYMMFHGAYKLKKIIGWINCSLLTSTALMISLCYLLEYVNLKYLKISISLKDSPLLLRECILYAITNASNTTPITLTLHADAFARLTEADIALASSKNITLARA